MPWRRRRVTQVDQTPPPPPPTGRYVEEHVAEPPPAPRRPLLWPWLLLLLLLVGTGIALAYVLTRDDDNPSSADRVPAVVGLTEAVAVDRLRSEGYPADTRRTVDPARVGKVVRQTPSAGAELEPGKAVVIVVARRPNTVDVPRVVGLEVADAFERVQAAKLRAQSIEVFARQAKGRVIRQRPPAGAEARRGATVVLSVSKGPQLVAVPPVIGQTEAEATAALRRVGLRANLVPVPSPGPEGTVTAQNPKGGVRAPKGSTVRLNVSTGPQPDGSGSTQTVPTTGEATVPNVVGSRDTDASARLQAAGFRVSSTPVSSTRPAGTVLTQSPAGGTSTTRGSTVRITVSGGRQVRTVPDVVGETETAADRILRDAGFTVRVVDRPVTDPAQDGLVVQQDPRAGTRVQGTTQVTIHVGRLA
ncbi:MAG: PASTA domain-containing protein [Actinobacteria bacterium]|nr:PASTA domain-containing protein [Actinomycetota bacterium]